MKCVNCKNLGKLKDEDGVPYDWCEKVCDNLDIHLERKCKHYVVASHADKIRSMTDEELADYFAELSCWPNAGREDCRGMANCMDCWLYWLRQEADT